MAPVPKWFRTQDLVWLFLFALMLWASPYHDVPSYLAMGALATLQLLEPRFTFLQSRRGVLVAVGIKLLLCWLVIGYTNAVNSSYYPILLLPVVSAATACGPWVATSVTLLACLAYLSFLLFLDPEVMRQYLFDWQQLLLRIIFLPVVGFLTYGLSRANRLQMEQYQQTAHSLEEANRNLQAAEDAVRRGERLAALGQLTAGLAHELRNPMGTIRGSAEMLRKRISPEDAVAKEMTGYITSEVDRANSLITRFLEFARPLHLRMEARDLHELIDHAITQLQQEQLQQAQLQPNHEKASASIYRNYDPTVPQVRVDGEWMERVFFNLLQNAQQASPASGTVTVKTKAMEDGAVEVSFIDRGSGIPPENLASIFNPFFTTKRDGVGLGLAIVAKLVDEHGGQIFVESQPKEGSIFRIHLPGNKPSPSPIQQA